MREPGWRLAVGSMAVVATMAACSDLKEQSLCTVYTDEYLAAVQAVGEVRENVEQTSAGRAVEVADDAIAAVRHLNAVADNRYTDAIEQLETSIEDVRRVLASVEPDAEFSVWQPLVTDSVDDAEILAARVEGLIDPTCQPEQ